jgi:hypothetical protein
MSIPDPELLVNDGFMSVADQVKMKAFFRTLGSVYVKIALNFGYVSRKNYERSLSNAGYVFPR